jgi:hypothetical protein
MTPSDDNLSDASLVQADAIARIANERGWPPEIARRLVELRVPLSELNSWTWFGLTPEQAKAQLGWHERLTSGDLRGRDATYADNEAFSELWSESPEEIGEWEITVERGPDAFAQFKLQENVHIPVLAIGPRLIACCAFARRQVLIGGLRVSVVYGQALRVHRAYRRMGYGDQVRRLAGPPASSRPAIAQYDYMRTQNFAVANWWQKFIPGFFDNVPKREGSVPGIPVSVAQFPARASADDDRAIRPARSEDLSACAELINRTHAGTDLFRPYSTEYLGSILDEGFWDERPAQAANPAMDWWKPVYSWRDYFVLDEGGRIRACAGLWDRGRDMRERWRRIGGQEERTIAVASVLDFGYADGAEEAMARLLNRFIGRAHELGRDYLAISLEHAPALAARMEGLSPEQDARALRWGLKEPEITRPYTDLRYW